MMVSYMIEGNVIYDQEQTSAPMIGEMVILDFYRSGKVFKVIDRIWLVLRGKVYVTVYLKEIDHG